MHFLCGVNCVQSRLLLTLSPYSLRFGTVTRLSAPGCYKVTLGQSSVCSTMRMLWLPDPVTPPSGEGVRV